jgi:hypothetical protein
MSIPYKAIDYIIQNAPKFAAAKGQRVYLENFLRTKKALLMKDAMQAGFESAAAQEREAYAHPEYQELLKGLAAATETEECLKFMLIAAQLKSEIWRTESANERSGIKATE